MKRTSVAYVTSKGYPELARHARVIATYEGFRRPCQCRVADARCLAEALRSE